MTTPLKEDFDCTTKMLKIFLSGLGDRAGEYGWENVLEIPEVLGADPPENRNLLTEYGRITLDQVTAQAATYIANATRQAQNSYALYLCVMATLSRTARAKVMLKEDEYTVNGIRSGPCLLKVVIRLSYLDSNATTKFIRESLSNLDDYMLTVNSDIEKFNEHVEDLTDSLAARGEESQDLLANLFKAYAACEDEGLKEYMDRKESAYDEGQTFQPVQLMKLALDKFATLKLKGKWMAQSDDQKKIVALEAQVSKLQNKFKSAPTGTDTSGKETNNQSRTGKDKKFQKPEWMTQKPNENEEKEKEVNNKIYYWCPTHKAWTRHKPEECKGLSHRPSTSNSEKAREDSTEDVGRRLVRALAAVAEEEPL